MKKIYLVPELNVVKVRHCCLLQVSANADGDSIKYEGNRGDAGSEGLSRSFSFGDDE